MFVVWEPILPTDWLPPRGRVQSRISDARVVQFWDKGHLVAKDMRRQLVSRPNSPPPGGVLWDFAALYGKETKWGDSSPKYAEGPVVYAAPNLASRLATQAADSTAH